MVYLFILRAKGSQDGQCTSIYKQNFEKSVEKIFIVDPWGRYDQFDRLKKLLLQAAGTSGNDGTRRGVRSSSKRKYPKNSQFTVEYRNVLDFEKDIHMEDLSFASQTIVVCLETVVISEDFFSDLRNRSTGFCSPCKQYVLPKVLLRFAGYKDFESHVTLNWLFLQWCVKGYVYGKSTRNDKEDVDNDSIGWQKNEFRINRDRPYIKMYNVGQSVEYVDYLIAWRKEKGHLADELYDELTQPRNCNGDDDDDDDDSSGGDGDVIAKRGSTVRDKVNTLNVGKPMSFEDYANASIRKFNSFDSIYYAARWWKKNKVPVDVMSGKARPLIRMNDMTKGDAFSQFKLIGKYTSVRDVLFMLIRYLVIILPFYFHTSVVPEALKATSPIYWYVMMFVCLLHYLTILYRYYWQFFVTVIGVVDSRGRTDKVLTLSLFATYGILFPVTAAYVLPVYILIFCVCGITRVFHKLFASSTSPMYVKDNDVK